VIEKSAHRLVLVTNRRTAQHALPELAARAIAGGVDLVQIREKDLPYGELLELARAVLDVVRDPKRLMINGSTETAADLGIGLHLPERASRSDANANSLPCLSRSVHTPASAHASDWVDFVIAGHVYPTPSKPGLEPMGVAGLAEIVGQSPVPVIAIGGIVPDQVRCVIEAGASGVAVQSAINDADDPEAAACQFKSALEEAMTVSEEQILIQINGKPKEVPAGMTVLDYLKERGHHDRLVVVELNGKILAKSAFPATTLSAGDRVEIVHFVGGG
jgi:thiamine biosynthesis protein ThiS